MAAPAVLRFSRGLPPTKQFGERLRLLVVQGNDKGVCYSLLGETIFVGREDSQITLNDTNISRKHAEISWQGDHYTVRDLGSANGILHNGEKVPSARLSPGDLVLMGLTVFEVYPAGQVRRNEKPQLPGPLRRQAAAAAPALDPVKQLSSREQALEKRKTERKRLIIVVIIFFLLGTAYFSDKQETMTQHAAIPPDEEEITPRAGERYKDTQTPKKISSVKDRIEKARRDLAELEKQKAQLAELARVNKTLLESDGAVENAPASDSEKQQRNDAQVFFRSGVREMQNKNYRRAFTAFETAITVDPTHELAKIYLKSAKMEMIAELRNMQVAGLRAKDSLRYKESKMHFQNIVRYLDSETGSAASMDQEANKDLKELLEEAKKELQDIEERENRGR